MFYEDKFEMITFRDLRPGHVLIDIPNVYAVVATGPLMITRDLAVVGLKCWTIASEVLAEPTAALAALDDPDQVRRIYEPRHRRPWTPPQPVTDPLRDPGDRLEYLADR